MFLVFLIGWAEGVSHLIRNGQPVSVRLADKKAFERQHSNGQRRGSE
jgi:hypothetical protein